MSRIAFSVLLMCLLAVCAWSVQIDASNWPMYIGNVLNMYHNNSDYTFGFAMPGTAPWDFTACPHDHIAVITYKDPTTVPGSSGFPTATLALEQVTPGGTTMYTFYKSDSAGFYMLGRHFMSPAFGVTDMIFNAPVAVVPFPSTVGNTWNTTTYYAFSGSNYTVTVNGQNVSEGNMTVPYGTRECLVSRTNMTLAFPGGVTQYGVQYHWLAPNIGDYASAIAISYVSMPANNFTVASDVFTLNTATLGGASVEVTSVGNIKSLYR